jgi:hypothetical protein
MISIVDKKLILIPKKGSTKPLLELPLLQGYTCPACGHVVYGIIDTKEHVNLSIYADSTSKHSGPVYAGTVLHLLSGQSGQLFSEAQHYREGTLNEAELARSNGGYGYQQCRCVKMIYEPDPMRRLQRFYRMVLSSMRLDSDRLEANLTEAANDPTYLETLLGKAAACDGVYPVGDRAGNGPLLWLISKYDLRSWQVQNTLK